MEPRRTDALFFIRITLGLIVVILLGQQYSLLMVGSKDSIIPISVEDQPTIKKPITTTDTLNIFRDLKTVGASPVHKLRVQSQPKESKNPLATINDASRSTFQQKRDDTTQEHPDQDEEDGKDKDDESDSDEADQDESKDRDEADANENTKGKDYEGDGDRDEDGAESNSKGEESGQEQPGAREEDAAEDMNVDSKGEEPTPSIPRQNQTAAVPPEDADSKSTASINVARIMNSTNSSISNLDQRYIIPKDMIADLDMDNFEKFQAEIDRRLPLWQAEAAKEDIIQDPPTVKKYDGVVLATKVHSPGRDSINQMICLQKAAYNHRRNYPWVIFHTVPVTAQQVAEANALAYPGTVTFVRDSPPLEEVVGNFSKEEQDYLINRCQCCHPKEEKNCCKDPSKKIDWGFWCYEQKTGWVTLSYAWQAVFRSYNIWTEPSLKDHKWMIWIDDDAIPTKSWLKDPIKPMVEEDLVIFYDNFPAGFCKSGGIIEKQILAYNHSYCYIHRVHVFKGPQTGKFVLRPCKKNKKGKWNLDKVGLVHGMFHITNLDVYRKPVHLNFQRLLTEHETHPFSREWDDQIAVTIPAAFENPEKAWDMRVHGFNMSVHHNGKLDGKNKNKRWRYTTWWKYHKDEFPVAREMCNHLVRFAG